MRPTRPTVGPHAASDIINTPGGCLYVPDQERRPGTLRCAVYVRVLGREVFGVDYTQHSIFRKHLHPGPGLSRVFVPARSSVMLLVAQHKFSPRIEVNRVRAHVRAYYI